MTIELFNFGPVQSYRFDLDKDLHAIFGKNNIGKSYSISAVYLILKNLLIYRNHYRYYDPNIVYGVGVRNYPKGKSFEDSVSEKISSLFENRTEISLQKETEQAIAYALNRELISLINQSFTNSFYFEQIQSSVSDKELSIILNFKFAKISIGLSDKLKDKFEVKHIQLLKDILVKKINSNRHHKYNDNALILYMNAKTKRIIDFEQCVSLCLNNIVSEIQNSIQNVYFLPASRSGLYNALSAFGAIIAELSQSRNFLRSKIEIPSISEPISDYFLNLTSVRSAGSGEFDKYIKAIEDKILKGKVIFNSKSKKFLYVPNDMDMQLDLSFTSSMISEIAPIVAHLKFILSNRRSGSHFAKNLIFIEEPEAHLHPEVQVQLAEYFIDLVNSNLKIVMTSHSNYIFNKFSNLVVGKRISIDKLDIALMIATRQGSILKKGAMNVDEYGIEDNNFVDVAEALYEERMNLIHQANEQHAD